MENNKIDKAYDELMRSTDQSYKLTDDDVESIVKTIESERSPLIEEILKLPSNNGIMEVPPNTKIDPDLEEMKQLVLTEHDPITGKFKTIGDYSEFEKKKSESIDSIINTESFSKDDISIDRDILHTQLKMKFNLTEDHINTLIDITLEYNDKKEVPVFSRLPGLIQSIINAECVKNNIGSKEARNGVLKSLLDDIIEEYILSNSTIEFDDSIFENLLKSSDIMKDMEDGKNEIISIYNQFMKEKCESYKRMADECRDTDPDKAALLINISDSYEDSLNLNRFKDAIKNRKIKIKKIDLEKYNKVFREFDFRYENSTLNIYSVSLCPHVLDRHIGNKYTTNDIISFVVAFCKLCKNMRPDNLDEHVFMYYTIRNIIMLDFQNDKSASKESKQFCLELINNISECIDLLKSYEV